MPLIGANVDNSWLVIEHNDLEPPRIICYLDDDKNFCIRAENDEFEIRFQGEDAIDAVETLIDRGGYLLKQSFGKHQLKIIKLTDSMIIELKEILAQIQKG